MGFLVTNPTTFKSYTITIPNADVLQLNSAPYLLISAQVKIAFIPVSIFIRTQGTLPFAAATELNIQDSIGTAVIAGFQSPSAVVLSPIFVTSFLCNWNNLFASSGASIPANRNWFLSADVDPTTGDGDIIVTIYGYEISL